jgi:predicted dehydrogenase
MDFRLVIADPGHFHAALLQKEMYPWLDKRVAVYAPLGADVLDYLARIARFNSRKDNPTNWEMDVHLTADPMGELLRDRAGNIVIFAGRNRGKIHRMLPVISAGFHVLADKPWIIESADIPKLEEALAAADRAGVAAYDIMTERFEVTSQLQRVFVNTPEVFGELCQGTADDPAIRARSVHHLMKLVAGVPLRRPAWFFDIREYGEGLADVGTHVVDLVQWTAFAGQAIHYRLDIDVIAGRRWPTSLSESQFAQVTGETGAIDYYCNNSVHYTLRGVHVKLEIVWDWEAPAGSGDAYEAGFRGTKASVEIRQGVGEGFIPEVYIVPFEPDVFEAVRSKVSALQSEWPGLAVEARGEAIRIAIPARFRVGHEAHFAQVANCFFDYVKSPKSIPAWERPNMLAKYYVTTRGAELSHKDS